MMRTIIVADDNELDRRLLHDQLKDEYEILEATNGVDLLSILEKEWHRISVILLDVTMPVLNGFEALDKIRAVSEYMSIPVVIITGDTDMATKKKAVMSGANGYLSKPYDPYLLKIHLRNIISFRENAA